MKGMDQVMQKAPSVIKLLLCFLFINCGVKKIPQQQKSECLVEKFKTLNLLDSWIKIRSYDKDLYNQPISQIIVLNNIHFLNDSLFDVGVGKHNIKIAHPSKISIYINDLVVKQGDSIVIKAYLKDDSKPIVD